MNWVDLRDRYGITQLILTKVVQTKLSLAKTLGREFVIQVKGKEVIERVKNPILGNRNICYRTILAATPPFTIEDETDGGEDIRMKYRYLDINPVKNSLLFRHKVAMEVRKYLSDLDFVSRNTILNKINSRRST
jgi:aspartyl-tRNA synthetase